MKSLSPSSRSKAVVDKAGEGFFILGDIKVWQASQPANHRQDAYDTITMEFVGKRNG
jgi:hypothetical protein